MKVDMAPFVRKRGAKTIAVAIRLGEMFAYQNSRFLAGTKLGDTFDQISLAAEVCIQIKFV